MKSAVEIARHEVELALTLAEIRIDSNWSPGRWKSCWEAVLKLRAAFLKVRTEIND